MVARLRFVCYLVALGSLLFLGWGGVDRIVLIEDVDTAHEFWTGGLAGTMMALGVRRGRAPSRING